MPKVKCINMYHFISVLLLAIAVFLRMFMVYKNEFVDSRLPIVVKCSDALNVYIDI